MFRLATLVLAPVLFVGATELALRLFGYGFATSLFIPAETDGVARTNPRYAEQFFPSELARAPQSFQMRVDKPAKTYRIVLLGESAAKGYPDETFAVGRVLEVMLEHEFPQTDVEVLNLGVTAINSHVIRKITAEALGYDPDLLVVYAGNNEVVGPFGPGTVFSGFSPNMGAIRLAMEVKSWRLGQLISDAMGAVRGGGAGQAWTGMGMFLEKVVPQDDPRLAIMYDHFRRNLQDIVAEAGEAGVPVVLATVGCNLRDCAPFVSRHKDGLSQRDLEAWQAAFDAARAAQEAGDVATAIARFTEAIAIDGHYAEAHFRLAQCLLINGRRDEAAEHFTLARDADALRFRPDRHVIQSIRDVAAGGAAGVVLVDAEPAFAAAAPDGIPGVELFHEHVHLTFRGNYVLARALREEIAPLLAADGHRADPGSSGPLSLEQAAQRMAFTPFDAFRTQQVLTEQMLRHPPFTNQFDHALRLAEAERKMQRMRAALTPEVIEQCLRVHEAAVNARPDDARQRVAYAWLLAAAKRDREAAAQFEAALVIDPFAPEALYAAAGAAANARNFDKANAYLERLIAQSPATSERAELDLARNLVAIGRLDEAVERLDALLDRKSGNPSLVAAVHVDLAEIHAQRRNLPVSLEHLRAAIQANPNSDRARLKLAEALAQNGDDTGAAAELRTVSERFANDPLVMRDLARTHARLGNVAEADAHYERAATLAPEWTDIRAERDAFRAQLRSAQRSTPSGNAQPAPPPPPPPPPNNNAPQR